MSEFGIRRGNPTPEEIAIAISVLRAAAGAQTAADTAAHAPLRNWAAPHHSHRSAQHIRGRGAWTLAQRIR
jgi:hypothetical protein